MSAATTSDAQAQNPVKNLESNSMLKRYLTDDVYKQVKDLKTGLGSTIHDCIASGLANPSSKVGVYAADVECYEMFAPMMDPIIRECHKIPAGEEIKHPASDFSGCSELTNLDAEGKYVVSTRCRTARTLTCFPMNSNMTKEHYLALQEFVKKCVASFEGELKGTYHALAGMDEEFRKKLVADHFLFKNDDPYLKEANALNHWPEGRGIFLSANKTFLIWCGEEDHLRLISMQPGADIAAVVARLEKALAVIQGFASKNDWKFSSSSKHGFHSFCPTNVGTGIRCSVHIKLPLLSSKENYHHFERIAEECNIQIRGTDGEHSESKSGIYDLSNKQRHGASEITIIKSMHSGIQKMIASEKKLENGEKLE